MDEIVYLSHCVITRKLKMEKEEKPAKVTIDGIEYNVDDLSDKAKEQLRNINFVDARIQQLRNEWAISDTARIGYTNALKSPDSTLKTGG